MPKGLFTQSAAVLLERKVPLKAVADALAKFDVARRIRAEVDRSWIGGYPSLLVAMRPEVNGYVIVDVIDRPWPDGMGHPKKDPILFGAWGMGYFGPFVFPGGLGRAAEQSRRWQGAGGAVGRHGAVIRVKSSYVLGGDEDAPALPEDYDALAELRFVTDVARALLRLPGAVCYFNPNGETLHTAQGLDESLDYHRGHGLMPLEVWSNVRVFHFDDDDGAGWAMLDTVGMGQLDVDDQEACFPRGSCQNSAVVNFLRNATAYVVQNGPIIRDGNTMDGAGRRWRAKSFDDPIAPPPRRVLRWLPVDGPRPPGRLAGTPKRTPKRKSRTPD